ncbi:hypothetical protein RJT34_15408 [Clitoria ternatea]|uniref:Uncharacterized protein n=1 Tax=Clitoria ternatea TaxID=43366 RepID=A0AAN9J5D0_CLITE
MSLFSFLNSSMEQALVAENAMLCEKYGIPPQRARKDQIENQPQSYTESNPNSDVVTELSIGLPDTRTRRISGYV